MASPLPNFPNDSVRSKANWIGRYLAVERKFDDKLKNVLTDSLSGIDEAFGNLGDKFSDEIRRTQLSQSNRALRGVISGIFGETGDLIREHRQDAAVAAVDAGLFDQRSILSRVFKNPADRNAYAESLRQTGKRNIESVITRVLESERPLSSRVYHSEALANGQVYQVINRALARGDSAKNLARDVKALIRPDVAGGVSYAAMRLGRTEINNAFHAQAIHDAQESPWVQSIRWHLSKVHEPQGCVCEKYALQGIFDVDHVPGKPHPNCRCYITPELPDYDSFEKDLLSGQYNDYLDSAIFGDPPPSAAAKIPVEITPPKPEKLQWDGPDVAVPTKNKDVLNSIEYNWKYPTFDTNKKYLREGARDAAERGYSGANVRLLNKQSDEIPLYPDPLREGHLPPAAVEALKTQGKELFSMAVHHPPTIKPMYRGIMVEDSAKLEVGQQISMPLSSFTPKQGVAQGFAGDVRFSGEDAWKSKSIKHGTDGVLFELQPGAKAARLPKNYGAEEVVSQGTYEIVSTTPGETKRLATSWAYNPETREYDIPHMTDVNIPKRVVIKHVSLEEKDKVTLSAPELTQDKKDRLAAILARAEADVAAKNAAKVQAESVAEVGFRVERERQAAEKAAAAKDRAEAIAKRKAAEAEAAKDVTVPEKLSEANTVKQVTNFMQDKYAGLEMHGFSNDLTLDSVKEITQTFETYFSKFPDSPVYSLRVDNSTRGGTALTLYQDGKVELVFNKDYMSIPYKEMKKIREQSEKDGWSAKGTGNPWESTFIHEWGHVLDYSNGAQLSREIDPLSYAKRSGNRDAKVSDFWFDTFELLTGSSDWDEYTAWVENQQPSDYSKTNGEEMVAESFLSSEIGQAAKNKVVNGVVDRLLKNYEKRSKPKVFVKLRKKEK
jgi:hypothetical protein